MGTDIRELLRTGAIGTKPLDPAAVIRRERSLRRRGRLTKGAVLLFVTGACVGGYQVVRTSEQQSGTIGSPAQSAPLAPVPATITRTINGRVCTTVFTPNPPIVQGCADPFPHGSPAGALAWIAGNASGAAPTGIAGVTDPDVATVKVVGVDGQTIARLLTFADRRFPGVRFFGSYLRTSSSATTLLALDGHNHLLRRYPLGPALTG
jgi:hypothetical protein